MFKKNIIIKKIGFTLIELLAVIVILAIIALIATPLVLNVIDNAKKESFRISTYGIIKAAENSYDFEKEFNYDISFTYENGIEKSNIEGMALAYSGKRPNWGTVIINNEGRISVALYNGTWCTIKGFNEEQVNIFKSVKEDCNLAMSAPYIELLGDLIISVEIKNDYIEPGYIGKSIDGEDITEKVKVEIIKEAMRVEKIDTNKLGMYEITYSLVEGSKYTEAKRVVKIVDTEEPNLTIPGNITITTEQVSSFDLMNGASVTDNSEENIDVIISGNLSVVPGNYTIAYTATDSSGNKTDKFRIITVEEAYFDESKGVNKPRLSTGMTPIKWNGTTEVITTEDDPEWYDYNNKKWANAKTNDGSYWVWIPRYAYKITSGYHSSTTGTIDIKFLKGKSNNPVDGTKVEASGYIAGIKDTNMHYFLHPSFIFDGETLGFWVAKFEASVSNKNDLCYTTPSVANCDKTGLDPKFIPNANVWRYTNNKNFYNASLKMKTKTTVYGWKENEVDTHMMKNTEWGAVAYLTKSKYGANNQRVWNNAYYAFLTGCSASGETVDHEATCIPYNTTNGLKASSTHNIYGIYDLNGGAGEATMANFNNYPGKSTFNSTEMSNINSKYIDRYYIAESDLYEGVGLYYDSAIYGDAVYETSYNARRRTSTGDAGPGELYGSWFGNESAFGSKTLSWFIRGGFNGQGQGIFAFHYTNGDGSVNPSFRSVLFIY